MAEVFVRRKALAATNVCVLSGPLYGGHGSATPYRRSVWIAVLAASAAIGLAACGGTNSPRIANLGKNVSHSAGSTATTLPTGEPAQLLDEWAACLRRHGDPNQVDPTVDTDQVIQVTLPAGYAGGLRGGNGACGAYLTAAQTALGGGKPPETPDPATALKFAQCMRSNGIADYPDPGSNNQTFHATGDLNPASPAFQNAATLCANRTGFQKFASGTPQPGSINVTFAGGPPNKPGGNGGSAANPGAGSADG